MAMLNGLLATTPDRCRDGRGNIIGVLLGVVLAALLLAQIVPAGAAGACAHPSSWP